MCIFGIFQKFQRNVDALLFRLLDEEECWKSCLMSDRLSCSKAVTRLLWRPTSVVNMRFCSCKRSILLISSWLITSSFGNGSMLGVCIIVFIREFSSLSCLMLILIGIWKSFKKLSTLKDKRMLIKATFKSAS